MSTQSTPPSFSLTKLPIVCLLAGICCALWGSAFPCVKIGYMLFSVDTAHVPSILLFAGMRFFLAGVLAVLIGSAAARRPLLPRSRRTWRHIAHLSLLQTILQYIFFYIGLAHTTGVKGSIIGASNAFAALLIAALLFRQETADGTQAPGLRAGLCRRGAGQSGSGRSGRRLSDHRRRLCIPLQRLLRLFFCFSETL